MEALKQHESGLWLAEFKLEKYEGDSEPFARAGRLRDFFDRRPYDVIEGERNVLANAGITILLQLLTAAAAPTAFSNAAGYLGVGTSNTAAAASQTDLQANGVRKAMDATFPSVSAQTATWKSTFASGDANQAWEEWAIFNASSSGTMLNRKVASMGTKASGTSWALTVTVSIS